MIIAIIFGAIVSFMSQQTLFYKDCSDRKFEPKACHVSGKLKDASEKMSK